MKFKHIFMSLALAVFLGLGIGAALKHSEVKETKAGNTAFVISSGHDGWVSHTMTATAQNVTVFHGGNSTAAWYYAYESVASGTQFYIKDGNNNTQSSLWLAEGAVSQNLTQSGNNLVAQADGNYTFYVAQGIYSYGSWGYGVACVYEEAEVTIEYDYALIGDRNEWESDFADFEEQSNGTFVATVHLTAGENFKIRTADAWTFDWGYQSINTPGSYFSGEGTGNITVGVSGTYTFTLPSDFHSNNVGTVSFSIVPDIADGAYLRGGWANGWTEGGQLTMTTVTANQKYSINGVNLDANSAVKMVVYSGGLESYWGEFNSVSSNDDDHYPVKTIDDGDGHTNAGVVSTGTYNIEITKNANGKWDYAFTGTANTDLEAAITFANNFVTAMNTNCPYTGTNKTAADVASAWSSQITTYSGLTTLVKSYLTNFSTSVSAITSFHSSYDWIYGHYSNVRSLSGADFLAKNPTIYPANNMSIVNVESNSTQMITIIVVVSSVSLIALGGFLLAKKRKEN